MTTKPRSKKKILKAFVAVGGSINTKIMYFKIYKSKKEGETELKKYGWNIVPCIIHYQPPTINEEIYMKKIKWDEKVCCICLKRAKTRIEIITYFEKPYFVYFCDKHHPLKILSHKDFK